MSSPTSLEMPIAPTPEITEQLKSEGAAAPAPAPEPPQAVAVTEPPVPIRKKHIDRSFHVRIFGLDIGYIGRKCQRTSRPIWHMTC